VAKVYIVDDDPGVRKALCRLMRSAGIDCDAFASGAEFLSRFDRGEHGCVLLDYHMRGGDGPEVLGAMAQAGLSLPVIILSAHDDAEMRKRARRLGAAGFFRKPVDDQALLDAIAWALGAGVGQAR
jgi:FixJ family two-component response regulator